MNRPAGSPLVGQAPAAEKTVTHSAALPYVDNWTLRPRPGAEASWTQLGLYENGRDYFFLVDDRRVGYVTDIADDTAA